MTTIQAGKVLGITGSAVRDLIANKVLNDKAPIIAGHKRHYYNLDSKQVHRFKKVFHKKHGYARYDGWDTGDTTTVAPVPAPKDRQPEVKVKQPAQGILTRLDRIEEKLNRLIDFWI